MDLVVDLGDPGLMLRDADLSRLGTTAEDLLGLADLLLDLGLVLQHDRNVGVAAGVLLGLLHAKPLKLGLGLSDDLGGGTLVALAVAHVSIIVYLAQEIKWKAGKSAPFLEAQTLVGRTLTLTLGSGEAEEEGDDDHGDHGEFDEADFGDGHSVVC